MTTAFFITVFAVTTVRLYRTLTAPRRARRDAAMYADTDI